MTEAGKSDNLGHFVSGRKEAGAFSPSEGVAGYFSFHRSDFSGAARQKPELPD